MRPMLFVVDLMMGLIAKEVPGNLMMLRLVRALGRYQKHVRENAAYNLNVKIKAWVMAQAERRAWVRSIIGEVAIRRWQWRRDNLYASTTTKLVKTAKPISIPKLDFKPYSWKRFAMADLSWLEIKPLASLDTSLSTTLGGWQNARESRGFKPIEFWAFELAADYDDYAPAKAQKATTPTATKEQAVAKAEPQLNPTEKCTSTEKMHDFNKEKPP